MKNLEANSWKKIQNVVLEKILKKEWKPGDLIPNEVDLALELGCARTTVNRALRAIADAGFVERKRKAGTRIRKIPITKATFQIPIIRQEIEKQSKKYAFKIIKNNICYPNEKIKNKLNIDSNKKIMYLELIHFSNNLPYLYEKRWINLVAIPNVEFEDFDKINPNEWLIRNVLFTKGNFSFYSSKANKKISSILCSNLGDPIFTIKRTTWNDKNAITFVKLFYHKGYQLKINF